MSGITDFSKLPLRAQGLLRRAQAALGRLDGINRLVEERQPLEQIMPAQVHRREAAEELKAERARREAGIQRLCRPNERLARTSLPLRLT